MNRFTIVSTIAFFCILFGACTDRLSIAEKASAQPEPTAERQSSGESEGSGEAESADESGSETQSSDHQSTLNPEVHDIYPVSGDQQFAADDDSEGDDSDSDSSDKQMDGIVNLNEASTEQLTRLHGIGPAIAERIEAYRNKRRFEKPSHIKRVRGIGEVTFENLKPYLAVEGKTTIAEK